MRQNNNKSMLISRYRPCQQKISKNSDIQCKKELKKYDILNNNVFNELADSLNAFRTGNIDTSTNIDNEDMGQLLLSNICYFTICDTNCCMIIGYISIFL